MSLFPGRRLPLRRRRSSLRTSPASPFRRAHQLLVMTFLSTTVSAVLAQSVPDALAAADPAMTGARSDTPWVILSTAPDLPQPPDDLEPHPDPHRPRHHIGRDQPLPAGLGESGEKHRTAKPEDQQDLRRGQGLRGGFDQRILDREDGHGGHHPEAADQVRAVVRRKGGFTHPRTRTAHGPASASLPASADRRVPAGR